METKYGKSKRKALAEHHSRDDEHAQGGKSHQEQQQRQAQKIPQCVEEVGPGAGAVRCDLAVEGEKQLQVPAPLCTHQPGTEHPQPSAQNKGCAQEQKGTGVGETLEIPTV